MGRKNYEDFDTIAKFYNSLKEDELEFLLYKHLKEGDVELAFYIAKVLNSRGIIKQV